MENSICQPILSEEQLKKHLIDDTIVNCIMCGNQGRLSRLVEHQKQCPSRPKWKTGFNARDHKRCVLCINHPWIPKKFMDRHLRRKHPNENRTMIVQPMTKIIKIENGDDVNMVQKTAEETVSVAAPTPQLPQQQQQQPPPPPKVNVPETPNLAPEPQQQVSGAVPQFTSVNGYTTLSVESDNDGFGELVLTLF